jgi:hypothetical protein
MITREMELTQVAVNFAARFGFLSKEIFFEARRYAKLIGRSKSGPSFLRSAGASETITF